MKLIEYLDKNLKSNELIQLFEDNNVDVIYAYDRLHEGTQDKYYAAIPAIGIEFVFNENQTLRTIFVYASGNENFCSADLESLGLSNFNNKEEVIQSSRAEGVAYQEGEIEFLGKQRSWAKQEYNGYSIHFEFIGGLLCQVTVQSKNA